MLRGAVEGVPVDYVGTSISNSSSDSNDAVNVTASTVSLIKSVDSIEAATPVIWVTSASYMNSSGGTYLDLIGEDYRGSAVFLSNDSTHLLDSFKVVGSVPDSGTAAIPKSVADSLNLGIGDEITCVFKREQYYRIKGSDEWHLDITYLNITSPVSGIWTQPEIDSLREDGFDTPSVSNEDGGIWLGVVNDPVVFNLADYSRWGINNSASDSLYTVNLSYFIWVDRGAVISLADFASTSERLDLIQTQLSKKLYSVGVTVSGAYLISPLESLHYNLREEEPLFLALSVPVLSLGIYLSMVGVDLGVTERRREAGILKSRGASDRQVFGSLIAEAIALGSIAGVVGLLLGALVSRFLLGAMATLGGEAITEVTDFVASSTTIVLSILFGIVLMLFSSYGAFKQISRTDVAQALHHYSPAATQSQYSASVDVVLLIISLWSIAATLLGSDWPSRQGFSWIAEAIVSTCIIFGIEILPLLPFLLSLSLVRLLTRGSSKLYSKFAWLVKAWTKDLHYLVDRNIVRNPRRASNLCVIISLALAFGLFISVTMESTMNYEREKVRFEVGSDLKVEALPPGTVGGSVVNASTLDAVGSLPGVEHVASYSKLDLLFDVAWSLYRAPSVVMNSTDYLQTVEPSDFYFVDGGSQMLESLSENGSVLVSKDFADQRGLQVGDTLPVVVASYAKFIKLTLTVVGFVKGLPGFPGVDAFIDRSTLSIIPYENQTGVFYNNGALIDVAADWSPREVASAAVMLYEHDNLTSSTTILQDRLDDLKRDPSFASLAVFLYMEYALSIVIMTLGVGLLIFVAVHDRENELACIMARGSSGRQLRRILMGESMSLMMFGLVVGVCVGILTAFLFNSLSGDELYAAVERKMVFTVVSFLILFSSIVALLAASLVATARAGKIRLAEVLRIRGG